ncbi:unnamed protein product [Lota lota]
MTDDSADSLDDVLTQFTSYEDFLDSKITASALYYLEDEELARQLVELGQWGSVLTREEFQSRKVSPSLRNQHRTLASAGKELKDNFLKALAEREENNRTGILTSIIFIRDRNAGGQEVSGYIDYAHRLQSEDFEAYFSGKKRLMPRQSDLRNNNSRCGLVAKREQMVGLLPTPCSDAPDPRSPQGLESCPPTHTPLRLETTENASSPPPPAGVAKFTLSLA